MLFSAGLYVGSGFGLNQTTDALSGFKNIWRPFTYLQNKFKLYITDRSLNMNREYLNSILNYNPDTGELTYKVDRSPSIRKGSKAGCICSRDKYMLIVIDGKKYLSHRIIWFMMTGEWPVQIDHINHKRWDNRWCNLREVAHQDNHKNKPLQSNNKSGYHGVGWNETRQKWASAIKVNGRRILLGRFKTKEEAIRVRKEAEIKYGFHDNHGK